MISGCQVDKLAGPHGYLEEPTRIQGTSLDVPLVAQACAAAGVSIPGDVEE